MPVKIYWLHNFENGSLHHKRKHLDIPLVLHWYIRSIKSPVHIRFRRHIP
jgi:hypothetical protein